MLPQLLMLPQMLMLPQQLMLPQLLMLFQLLVLPKLLLQQLLVQLKDSQEKGKLLEKQQSQPFPCPFVQVQSSFPFQILWFQQCAPHCQWFQTCQV